LIKALILFLSLLLLSACAHNYPPAPALLSQTKSIHHFHAGDRIKVTVFDEPNLSGVYDVNAQGEIFLPLTGPLNINNQTETEVIELLKDHLESGYMHDAKVAVTLDQDSSLVYVLGEVQKPGSYPFISGMTTIQAIAQAGGYTYRADHDDITLRRHDIKNKNYRKYSATEDTPLLAGDTLTVEERYF
jgi:protein involved in polysaccharide export with SLBB domain